MGNRAVIAFDKSPDSTGIYLHWNGGLESVLAFLAVCKKRGYRSPAADSTYAMARLIGVVHEFFASGTSVGVGKLSELDVDNYDNGAYLVGGDWELKERWGSGSEPILTLQANDGEVQFNGIVNQLMLGRKEHV